jgi:hypothetical protein
VKALLVLAQRRINLFLVSSILMEGLGLEESKSIKEKEGIDMIGIACLILILVV